MSNKFLDSISGRYGFDSLYYHGDHVRDTDDGLKAGVDLPWYWRISLFTSNTADKLHWLRQILSSRTGWGRYDDDYGLGINPKSSCPIKDLLCNDFIKRAFYTMKCVLCMFFCSRRHVPDHFFEYINVAIFDQQPLRGEYSGYNWNAVAVGYGVFENWYFWQYSDTSC